ncbi:MAG: nucleotidyltransferase domain-containing protein [Allosphingosinicella sp.]
MDPGGKSADGLQRIAEIMKPGSRPDVKSGELTQAEALAIARAYVGDHHPEAICSFVFGSSVAGDFQPYSDIDMIVIEPAVEQGETRRLMYEGVPIEVHILDQLSFSHSLRSATATGASAVVFAAADATLLTGTEEQAGWYRGSAAAVQRRGPPPPPDYVKEAARRNITVRITDLVKNESFGERSVLVDALSELLYLAHFARQGLWRKTGKWGPRRVPEFAQELAECLDDARHGRDFDRLVALAERELEPWGGFLWSGTKTALWPGKLNRAAAGQAGASAGFMRGPVADA